MTDESDAEDLRRQAFRRAHAARAPLCGNECLVGVGAPVESGSAPPQSLTLGIIHG